MPMYVDMGVTTEDAGMQMHSMARIETNLFGFRP